ncbi:MAG: ribose-phosphate pyrophosphokinase [Verrucomicrobia bacterium]|nr:ribose-phosphate pyrophosphokinase [Verrucomicrobiota bacterium]
MPADRSFVLFAGTSHPELATQIARELKMRLGKIQIETFPDNEIGVHLLENVRGRDVFVLQTIARHPNLYLMELLIIVDALKRASARSITAVVPYFGYARQDRKNLNDQGGRVPITAKLVADMLEKAGVARVLTMDLHAEQIQGFFDIPVDNIFARPLLLEAAREEGWSKSVVVAPDIGSIRLARDFAGNLKVDYAIVDKRRVTAKRVEAGALIGDVQGKNVILVDDICSTGETLTKASWVCKKFGAKAIRAVVTHGLLIGSAFEESAIEKMFVTNTVPLPKGSNPKIEAVTVAPLFAKAIDSMVGAKSISSLFQ